MTRSYVHNGDCHEGLTWLDDGVVDSIVTDPPYGLNFMGKSWDKALPDPAIWAECLRVLKPGGHAVIFGAPRLYHRLACQVEDAGFEVRDCIMWVFGSGFPKSHNVSKAIDRAKGSKREAVGLNPNARPVDGSGRGYSGPPNHDPFITAPATDEAKQWEGWGTALKPAYEPILLVRKPLTGTVAANVLAHGVGGLNVDGCRVESDDFEPKGRIGQTRHMEARPGATKALLEGTRPRIVEGHALGRWPANLILDEAAGEPLGERARFFYSPKAGRAEREAGLERFKEQASGSLNMRADNHAQRTGNATAKRANTHPTVKPIALMRYLCRLITPPNGLIVDPFTGSGSTGCAAEREGFRFLGFELSTDFVSVANARIKHHADPWAQHVPGCI